MNKAQLVEALAKEIKSSKAAAEKSVGGLIKVIKTGLKKDSNVQLVGFGTFKVVNRKARMGRNPQTGEAIKIKASKSVGFRAGKNLKSSL